MNNFTVVQAQNFDYKAKEKIQENKSDNKNENENMNTKNTINNSEPQENK